MPSTLTPPPSAPSPSPLPLLLSWSGGKDSAMALDLLRRDPSVTIAGLLTTVTADYDRVSIHGIRRSILHAQAAATGVPLVEAVIPAHADNDAYESAFLAALGQAAALPLRPRTIAFGDLFLDDVRRYRERMLFATEWSPVFPLWGRDTAQLARACVSSGLRAILCCVDTTQLAQEFAGREFDAALLADLPATVDPCGERGEFHTCVYESPAFAHPIRLQHGAHVLRDGRFMYCDLIA